MGFLIDSSLWIAVERGHLGAADIHAVTRQRPVYLSPVNIAEIRYGIGLMRDARQVQKASLMLKRLMRKPLLRITAETGEVFGALAARLHKQGRDADFRIQDLWLAAQAIQRQFTLLTANARDFQDIPDLDWMEIPISPRRS